MKKKTLLKIVLLVLATRVGFILLRQFLGFWWLTDIDRYTQYAQALFSGAIHQMPVRQYIFPGFSILIGLIFQAVHEWSLSAIITVIVGDIYGFLAIASVFSVPVATLSLFFPPAFLWSTSRIYSEGPMLALLYGSIWLWRKKKIGLALFIAGISCVVRPIGLALLLTYFIYIFKFRFKYLFQNLFIGLTPILFFLIFNFVVWGDFLFNLRSYQAGSTGLVPIISVGDGIVRLLRDHSYRTLFSGVFYFFLTSFGVVVLSIIRNRSSFHKMIFTWSLLMWLFLLTIGPNSFFEDYGRYAVFLYPAIFWGFLQLTSFRPTRFMYISIWIATVLVKGG